MIFARRSIQRFVDSLSATIGVSEIAKLVRELNRNEAASLDFEWEVAILYALSKLGTIAYERNHGGTRNPDVTFLLTDDEIAFVADIAAVSDRGLEDENPTNLLSQLLDQEAKKQGLRGGFNYQIHGSVIGPRFGDRKPKLSMPSRARLPASPS